MFCAILHFVDDFGCAEPSETSQSGFDATQALRSSPGFRFKSSKAQPPAQRQRLLGVEELEAGVEAG